MTHRPTLEFKSAGLRRCRSPSAVSAPTADPATKVQRLLAEYQQRTARVEAMLADNIKRGVYRYQERPFSRLLLQRPDDVQADWNQADEDQWGNQEQHWQASTRRGE